MSRVNPLWYFGRILSHTKPDGSGSRFLPQLSATSRAFSTGDQSIAPRRCIDTGYRAQPVRHSQKLNGFIAFRSSLSTLQRPINPIDKLDTSWNGRIRWRWRQHRAYSKGHDDQGPRHVKDGTHYGVSQTRKPDSRSDPVAPTNKLDAESDAESLTASMSKYLPHLPHRPTKAELLAAATNFRQRMKVRFKWMSIRSMRPWNADEWGAFVSWIMLGHIVWVLVGTTTFFSLLILSINTVFAQETLAQWVGDYLTQSAGLTVIFESAIVPKWRSGVISFRNVFVSRRPGQQKSTVSKGSTDAAAVAAAKGAQQGGTADEEDDGNYTQFDVTIANVNVTLSFLNWWNGKGLLKDVEVKGVRGVIDRTSVRWSSEKVDPLSYRHEHQPGDFEMESFKLEDLLLTIHQPHGFRPFSVSIYSCELPQLRKQWLFYDFLSAKHMSGSYDGSLFTIHPKQVHGTSAGENQGKALGFGEAGAWEKFSRLRIDGLKIDHLNRGVEGPFGWIYEGDVDIIADIAFPANNDESITKVVSDFYDQLEEVVVANRHRFIRNINDSAPDMLRSGHLSEAFEAEAAAAAEAGADKGAAEDASDEDRRYLLMDLRIHLNDVKAAVPLFTKDLTYVNQALVRPIVAYINAKKTYIPISCRLVKRASDFDGSWSVYDCGLMNDMSAETYDAFAMDIENQQSRVRRFKKVGFWTLSLAIHALFMGMAGQVA